METAIDRAIGGHDPDNRIWGPLSASEFLIVVQDVTTWALSNFQCFHARPEAEDLPTGVRIVADFYFTMMPRLLPPFASESDVRTLRKTPPLFMKHGDEVVVEIEQVGSLRNTVMDEGERAINARG
jgi:hypothetical protein